MATQPLQLFPDWPAAADEFSTGLLPSQKLREAIEAGYIRASQEILADQIQPSSIDLRLGPVGYEVAASFLPRGDSPIAAKLGHLTRRELDLAGSAVLEKGRVYIVPLLEELNLPHFLWGKANPKSTTGRLDVFTRLLADYAGEFESVPEGYKGKLYAEIAPRTFSIQAQQGARLNQLRILKGRPAPSETKLLALHEDEGLVYSRQEILPPNISKKSLWLSLDLNGTDTSGVVGYKAKRDTPAIDLSKLRFYDALEYWSAIEAPIMSGMILEPDDFYILASKERVRIPPGYAAEMVPFDPSVGEFRIHYAGFFDPGFGCRTDDLRGTHAVLEVRSHGVPFWVEDGQKVGRLVFEQMLAVPDKLYGRDIGSNYQFQGLALSKQFKQA
jgi:dCTP deaminase